MSLSKQANHAWKVYLHFLHELPVTTRIATTALLTYTGNVITQKLFEKQPRMNQTRALKFVLFSMMLTPISHYWYIFLDKLFPKPKEKSEGSSIDVTALKKLAVDELIYDPFCILFFFTVIGLLDRQSFGQIRERIRLNYWETQKMSWRVWPLVQLVNFMVVPSVLRLPFINIVSFFWGIFLQIMAGRSRKALGS